ncbi:MAG: phage/plasmid replication protein [Cyclobacteriaceae bacterium]
MDTIKAYTYYLEGLGKLENFEKTFSSEYRDTYNVKGIYFTVSKKDNVPISIYFEGSLPKFLYGTNLRRSTRLTLTDSIMKLQLLTGLNLMEFIVVRADMAINILMKYGIKSYLDKLGYMPRHYREPVKNSVYFKTGTKVNELVFYDKILEMKEKEETHKISPYARIDDKILRIEYRIFKKISKELGFNGKLRVRELCSEAIYEKLLSNLQKKYHKVQKKEIPDVDGVTSYQEWVMCNAIENVMNKNKEVAMKQLDDLIAKEIITKNQKKYFLAELNKKLTNSNLTKKSSFVIELNKKFNEKMDTLISDPHKNDFAYAI